MWLTSKDIRGLFIVAGGLAVATLVVVFFVGYLLGGCASSSSGYDVVRPSGPEITYCFKAEGLTKARCYKEEAKCQYKVSLLRDHHPWAKIEQDCTLEVK